MDVTMREAVAAATDTRGVWVARGAANHVGEYFGALFPEGRSAVVVADETTYGVAGQAVERALSDAHAAVRTAHVFPERPGGNRLHADFEHAEWLRDALSAHDAVPVAVGAGTINDLTKLGAHLAGRQYMVVATAASMDGYAAFGAAITRRGFKQTISCPAPRGVVGDTEILAAAPASMTASGFGDLAGKIPAGADWLLADAVGAERLDRGIWQLVQPAVREAMGSAEGLSKREPEAVERLFRSLVMSGLAMQAARSSRPASGAEHQLSHLWEMRHLAMNGEEVSHGFKVGVATVLVTELYERLLDLDVQGLDAGARVSEWPTLSERLTEARAEFAAEAQEMREQVLGEVRAKFVDGNTLLERLERVRGEWPVLRERLREQLLPTDEMRRLLALAGCPTAPEEIGLPPDGATASLDAARQIRRRYTVLDLAVEIGLLHVQRASPARAAG